MADVQDSEGSVLNDTEKPDESSEQGKTDSNDSNNKDEERPKDRFSVRQVTFSSPEKPTPNEKDDKNDKIDEETDNDSPEQPESPQQEHFTHGYETNEAVPMTIFYRHTASQSESNMKRPTLQQLRKGLESNNDGDSPLQPLMEDDQTSDHKSDSEKVEVTGTSPAAPKFGWIKGVLFGCLLNIWGVMLYLRLSWVVGQAGIGMATAVILLSAMVTILTTLSMSAICTNGEVKGGGAYFLISRSLGPEFGGSIGVIFSIASAVAVAMYVVGFSETVRDLLKDHGALMIDEVNDIRIIGIITVILVFGVTLVGLQWVVRTQIFLLAILIISILDVVIGTFIGPQSDPSKAQGFLGYEMDVFSSNMKPGYRGEGFFSVFAVFFPAATGILAGVNISGDLKNVNSAVPKGTLVAIIVSTLVYVLLAWLVGGVYLRDSSGIIAAVASNLTMANSTNGTDTMSCIPNCKYGLLNDFQIMEKVSAWGPIVTAGIFASTLSSALASFVGAPKTFQAVCKDKIFPKTEFFAVGHGPGDEPRRGYLLTFVVAVAFIVIGDLNAIAPIISNFFLIVYALINYATFAASLGRSPGWRPSFKYYNKWVSLIGAVLCLVIMFLIKWWSALLTLLIVVGLYKYVDYRKPDINWGSSGQANIYMTALRFTTRLNKQDDHVKNFRPQFLALTGRPTDRPDLLFIVSHMSRNVGLMLYGNVYINKRTEKTKDDMEAAQEETNDNAMKLQKDAKEDTDWLRDHKIKAFRAATTASNLRTGVQSMFDLCGLGKMRPNTVVIGFKRNWKTSPRAVIDEYFGVIADIFDRNFGLVIFRKGETETVDFEDGAISDSDSENDVEGSNETVQGQIKVNVDGNVDRGLAFQEKQQGTIDVWWLYDDGGLTVLLPYLLSQHRLWSGCQLRIFSVNIRSKHNIKSLEINMAKLMKKFRITASCVEQVSGASTKPSDENMDAFRKLPVAEELEEGEITDQKILRMIRIGELIHERSKEAKLVIISLPVPVAEVTTPLMYMSWLEVLSHDLPPVLMVRGNQTSVLTFYS